MGIGSQWPSLSCSHPILESQLPCLLSTPCQCRWEIADSGPSSTLIFRMQSMDTEF